MWTKRKSNSKVLLSVIYRISLPLYIYLLYDKTIRSFKTEDLNNLPKVTIILSLILSVLLFLGIFSKRDRFTRYVAIVLIFVGIVAVFEGLALLSWFFPIFVSLYFIVYGNE